MEAHRNEQMAVNTREVGSNPSVHAAIMGRRGARGGSKNITKAYHMTVAQAIHSELQDLGYSASQKRCEEWPNQARAFLGRIQ